MNTIAGSNHSRIQIDWEGRILTWNEAAAGLLGYEAAAIVGCPLSSLLSPLENSKTWVEKILQKLSKQDSLIEENRLKRQDGSWLWIELIFITQQAGEPLTLLLCDVSQIRRERLHISAADILVDKLINVMSGTVLVVNTLTHLIEDCSPVVEQMFGYSSQELLGQTTEILHVSPQMREEYLQIVRTGYAARGYHITEYNMRRKNGEIFPTEQIALPIYNENGQLVKGINIVRDISGRKHMEDLLSRYELFVQNARDIFLFIRQSDGQIIDANEAAVRSYGYSYEELFSMHYDALLAPEVRETSQALYTRRTFSSGILFETLHVRKDGIIFPVEVSLQGVSLQTERIILAVIRDATIRKHAEEELRKEKDFVERLIETAQAAVLLVDAQGRIMRLNKFLSDLSGYALEEVIHKDWVATFIPHEDQFSVRALFTQAMNDIPTLGSIYPIVTRDGRLCQIEWHDKTLRDKDNRVTGLLAIGLDVTERLKIENKNRQQFKRLTALRDIDTVITSSLNRSVTLSALLKHVQEELEVDAADILSFSASSQTMQTLAQIGFNNLRIDSMPFKVEGSTCLQAINERRNQCIADVSKISARRVETFVREGFVASCITPLIVKGQIKGVLEIFQRRSYSPDSEWLEFLDTLAGQTAIALDNADLFEGLQRSNMELMRAYEATIEGWSRAMDLRDQYTEGHSTRVTDLTLRLAKAMHIPEDQLIHIQRGSLLHDIGKMAIPDQILLKPGQLTAEEWEIMRRHPDYALDFLSAIHFLRPALDIPYCHHEKWDGSGYPRGLKGNTIPLAARIFAVVDVWDALSSNRPYRQAWLPDKVSEHIRRESGKHFDSQVVETFLNLIFAEQE